MMMMMLLARKACECAYMGQCHSKKKLMYVEGTFVEITFYATDKILITTGVEKNV